jgi:serine phosphatase RsbU (regulator of sigma subunit)
MSMRTLVYSLKNELATSCDGGQRRGDRDGGVLVFRKRGWSGVSPHLRTISLYRLRYLVAGRFFLGAAIAFLADLASRGALRGALLIGLACLFGAISSLILLLRRWSMAVRLALIISVVIAVPLAIAHNPSVPAPEALAEAYRFDAFAIFLTMVICTRLYYLHINIEGARQLRAETELELAQRLQQVLVPGVSFRNARLDVYGRSIPSEKVGGDLVDLITSESAALAYLLDVSGHGIPAGALMGSLKTAIRMVFPQPLPEMLDQINRVLPSVKDPNMYATLGALSFEMSGGNVEYTLAGHPPILHFRANGDVEHLTCEQFPLGLLPLARYESRSRPCGPGDLFAIYSDGIVEVANAADEQFGVRRLESELRARISDPLEAICDAVMTSSGVYGLVDDDRSLLLIRVVA